MLLSYKPLHLEAQQRLQKEGCVVDISPQRDAAEHEDLSGEKSLTLDHIAIDDGRSHQA